MPALFDATAGTSARPLRLAGYCRVSTDEQARSGLGLDAQEAALRVASGQRGWVLAEVVVDAGESGKSLDRPGVRRVLEAIAAGELDGVVVAKLDRLSRNLGDLLAVVEWLDDAGAALVALDLGVDGSTPAGRMMLHMLGVLAQFERERNRERTVDALASLRASGKPISGPSVSDRPELAERIAAMRASGMTLHGICDTLNAEGVPTLRGGTKWRPSSVEKACGYRRPAARRKAPDLPAIPRRRRVRVA